MSKEISITERLEQIRVVLGLEQKQIDSIKSFINVSLGDSQNSLSRKQMMIRRIRQYAIDDVTYGICVSLIKEHMPLFYDDFLLGKVIDSAMYWAKYSPVHQSIIFFDNFALSAYHFTEQPFKLALRSADHIVNPCLYYDRQAWCVPNWKRLHLTDQLFHTTSKDFSLTREQILAYQSELISRSSPWERNYYSAYLMVINQRIRDYLDIDRTINTILNFGGL